MVLKWIQANYLASVCCYCHIEAEFETQSGLIFLFLCKYVSVQFVYDIFDYYV